MAVTEMTGQAEGVSSGRPWRRWFVYVTLVSLSLVGAFVIVWPATASSSVVLWLGSAVVLLVVFLAVDRLASLWWAVAVVVVVVGGVAAMLAWAPESVQKSEVVRLGPFVLVAPLLGIGWFSGRRVAIGAGLFFGPMLLGTCLGPVAVDALSGEFGAAADVARGGVGDDHRFWVGPFWYDEFCVERNGTVYFWNHDGVPGSVVKVDPDGTVDEVFGNEFSKDREPTGCWVGSFD